MKTTNKELLSRLAKKVLENNINPELKKARELNLLEVAKTGKFIMFGVSKWKYTMPEGDATTSRNKCLYAWLEFSKNNNQIDLFEGVSDV